MIIYKNGRFYSIIGKSFVEFSLKLILKMIIY
jgi:hypothetical protein